ncbi:phosphoadenosine phosphosulfate reductase family protein [Solobacterium moorei]|jgi:3'-phosphoadenosine 5'-phosphosulfate sulfotransferase (PAPS reductase)/FAD synthetase and related enzymes|uniref:phosphoadenosine phosphosulfate reductase family protein n=1 Tax=Solobacterium moorei TaxID=102148 RepID=UPI0023F0972E|nr:phosphoadenosine phosphosulfate reductase family protein [Solobacterium moorei]
MDEITFYLEDLKSKFAGIDRKKYYLSYSGGKDSHFLYWFIKEYLHDEDIEIVAVNTRMEHPQIMKRMYRYADRVLLPEKTIKQVVQEYGSPCFSKNKDEFIRRYQSGSRSKNTLQMIQGTSENKRSKFQLSQKVSSMLLNGKLPKISPKCCDITKKKTIHKYEKEIGKKAILGVRQDEGALRKSKYQTCFTKDRKFTPIHDLSDRLLEEIIKKYDIEVPEIYEHISRTGCMGCPYGHYSGNTEKELNLLSPAQRRYCISVFKDSYDVLGVDYRHEQLKMNLEDKKNL